MAIWGGQRVEAPHHVLIEAMNDGALILRSGGIIVASNRRFWQMVHAPVEQIAESRWQRFFPTDEHEALDKFLESAGFSGAKGEFFLLAADGTSCNVELSARALEPPEENGFFVVVTDISQRKRQEEALSESEKRLRLLVNATRDYAIIMLDTTGRIADWNAGAQHLKGYEPGEALGKSFTEFYPPEDRSKAQRGLDQAAAEGRYEDEGWRVRKDGSRFWASVVITALRDNSGNLVGFSKLVRDITPRKRLEDLHAGRNRLLEMVANRAPLESIFNSLAMLIESQFDGILCSVLLLDEDGKQLRHLAAPSLPEGYVRAIDGEGIGPQAGSCGTAAFRGQPVIVTDIALDPLWVNYRDLAIGHGLRACWSAPIMSLANKVLGTFAMYYRQPRSPTLEELDLSQIATNFGRIAIEHHRAEDALRQSEERFAVIHDKAAFAIALATLPGGVLVDVNDAWVQLFGYSKAEALGKTSLELGINRDDALRARYLAEVQQHGSVRDVLLPAVTKLGITRFISANLDKVALGERNYVLSTMNDVTERKRAEERLSAALERLGLAQQAGHVCVWDWDMVSGDRYWTKECERIFGLPPGSYESMYDAWARLVHPGDLERVTSHIDRCLAEHRHEVKGDYRIIRPDGQQRWLAYQGFCSYDTAGKPTRLIGTLTDITERKLAEERLRRSEEFLDSIVEQSPHSMWIADDKGTFIRGNQALRTNMNVTDAELAGKYNLFRDEVIEESGFIPLVREAFEGGRTVRFTTDYDSARIRHVNLARTKRLDLDITISPVLGSDGKVTNAIIQHLDITEQRRTQEALRHSEERFRTMAESVPEIIFTCGADGRNQYKNPRFYEFTGLANGSINGDMWLDWVHPDDRNRVKTQWYNAVNTGHPFEAQLRFRSANGEYSWFLARARPILDSANRIVQWQGTCTNIESQKRAEETLEQLVSQRTAKLQVTVDELAQYSYSITHDLRAPLRAIQGYADMLKEDSAGHLPTSCEELIQNIMASAQRMENLIRDSLNYGKLLQMGVMAEPVDIGVVMRETIQSYPALQPPQAEVIVEGEFPLVLGNDAGLSQCVSNLLRNAVKFVTEGTKPRVRVWAEPRGEWLRVWFEDNGIGIATDLQEVIFGMFQQLDKRYEGSGIGLTIVRKAMERMGGKVGVESELGKGSRFWLDFRRA